MSLFAIFPVQSSDQVEHSNHNTHDQNILSFRRGEESGFTFFFKSFYASLCVFASGYVKDRQVAEDIASDSFMKVWEKRECFEQAAALKAYLYKTVYHGCLRWHEQAKKITRGEMTEMEGSLPAQKTYLENIIRVETFRELREAINSLPPKCKKIFTKLYVEGKSVRETAEELMLSISTVKNQKARGVSLLRTKLIPGSFVLALSIFLFS
jgi:RNA polymerase sigma-70 factor (ECF subfamily)